MTHTNGRIVLHDLADLAQFVDLIAPEPATEPDPAADAQGPPDFHPLSTPALLPAPVAPVGVEAITHEVALNRSPDVNAPVGTEEITALAVSLDAALTELAAITEAETRHRQQAAADVDRYRSLEDATTRLAGIVEQAAAAASEAARLTQAAITEEARAGATRIETVLGALLVTARARLAAAHDQATALAARPDVARLLQEECEVAALAEREREEIGRAERLSERLTAIHMLLAEGKENEARGMLGALGKDHPNSSEIASLMHTLDRRARAVKTRTAEQALRHARRLARHAPAEAVALLGPLDLDGLPDDLARQVYGCWLAAVRRIAPTPARHYGPRFGHGAVLVPTSGGRLEVVAAIGLPEWTTGRSFAAAALRGAQPL